MQWWKPNINNDIIIRLCGCVCSINDSNGILIASDLVCISNGCVCACVPMPMACNGSVPMDKPMCMCVAINGHGHVMAVCVCVM